MKELLTIHGEVMLVDDEDYEKAKQYRWTTVKNKGNHRVVTYFYNKETQRDIIVSYKELILGMKSKFTLQKNKNPFDLRRDNILVFESKRECAAMLYKFYKKERDKSFRREDFRLQQSIKAQRSSPNTSKKTKYFGMEYAPRLLRPWIVNINYNSKSYHLGSFLKDEHAAIAYDLKALELFGIEAKRNFPDLSQKELSEKLTIIKADNTLFSYETKSKVTQGIHRDVKKTSQYVGVCLVKQKQLKKHWLASITHHGKLYRLGLFYTEEDAARAYDEKAVELYGDEARLNFPRE
jgi:hypothetical protein